MTESDPLKLAEKALREILKVDAEARARRAAEWAALTPQQQQERIEQQERQAAADKRAKIRRAVERAAEPYRQHASLTLVEFAYLLHGQTPAGEFGQWWQLGPGALNPVVDTTYRVLASMVNVTPEPIAGLPLRPTDPSLPDSKRKFHLDVLLRVAREQGLGYAAILSEVLGVRPAAAAEQPPPAVVAATEPAAVSEAPGAIQAPAVAQDAWRRDLDQFLEDFERRLEAYATGGGQSIDQARADLLKRSTMKELHARFEDWQREQYGDERQRVQLQTFRLEVHDRRPQYKFPAGPRPGTSARDFIRKVWAALGGSGN